MTADDKYQQEINELKEEIKLLKQSTKQQRNPKTGIYRNNTVSESQFLNTTCKNLKKDSETKVTTKV